MELIEVILLLVSDCVIRKKTFFDKLSESIYSLSLFFLSLMNIYTGKNFGNNRGNQTVYSIFVNRLKP